MTWSSAPAGTEGPAPGDVGVSEPDDVAESGPAGAWDADELEDDEPGTDADVDPADATGADVEPPGAAGPDADPSAPGSGTG